MNVLVAFDWFGRFAEPHPQRIQFKAEVLKETPKRFQVRFLEAARRVYDKDEVAYVPKWACRAV